MRPARKGYKVVLVREPLVPRLAQQLRHLTMLLNRFPKWQCIPRCELGAVVRAGEAFDHLDQIRVLCCVGDRTRLGGHPKTLIKQTKNLKPPLPPEDRSQDPA